ncbi:MAG TPA: hypothetical protein PLI95_25910, partial [Polyangiaceae bacterium]|nr:hypothetical protein [Polyangiaceae bacterium]
MTGYPLQRFVAAHRCQSANQRCQDAQQNSQATRMLWPPSRPDAPNPRAAHRQQKTRCRSPEHHDRRDKRCNLGHVDAPKQRCKHAYSDAKTTD